MTSEERREIRYQNRKKAREKKAAEVCGKSFEEVFSYQNMLAAAKSCCNGVRWKSSTINFESFVVTATKDLLDQINSGKYKFRGFKYFKTIEHGKERDINALDIRDRAVQKCFCDYIMTEAYSRSFIYDNSASLPGKGMDMTIRRLKEHLREHYRKYGLEGGIYQFDFRKYFSSIPREEAKQRLRKRIHDPRLQEMGCQMIDDFATMGGIDNDPNDPRGVGLGSQVSQNIALDYADPIDHYIKDVLGIKGYARYMDDGYVISNSLEQLQEIRDTLTEMAKALGVELNEKKNIITPFKDHSFRFLKLRVRLEPTGKVVIKMSRKSIKAMRRSLYVFRRWVDEGRLSAEDVFTSYQSRRAHARRCCSYRTRRSMDILFVRLFEKELAAWRKPFKCSLRVQWNSEVGWIYYASKSEYLSKIADLDRTRAEREKNGFVPMCERPEWISANKNASEKAMDGFLSAMEISSPALSLRMKGYA